jgi:hypothetical protein
MALLSKLEKLVAWLRARPMRALIIVVAIESFIFVSLFVVFIWVMLTR